LFHPYYKTEDLPKELCKIAFDGIMGNKLAFTLEEMENSCPMIKIVSNGLAGS